MLGLRDVMVPMRGGVCLATDIYRPGREGALPSERCPVILERTPYDKSAVSRSELAAKNKIPRSRSEVAAYFVAYGYAVAYQDTRGRYRSEGKFAKYTSEAADGYNTVAWLTWQPWSNGRVGTMGLSYAAHPQAAFPTSNLFTRGHRIRLDISSSNYPHFDINSNAGEPEGAWTTTRIAVNTVLVDAARPSHVVLPIVRGDSE